MRFRSKIGMVGWFWPGIIFVGVGWLMAAGGLWSMVLVIAALAVFVAYTLLNTDYTIKGDKLYIRCGVSYKQTLDIRTIRYLQKTRSFMSAPAASLDRMDIRYGKSGMVLVSPRDEEGFVAALRAVNPDIELRPRQHRTKRKAEMPG